MGLHEIVEGQAFCKLALSILVGLPFLSQCLIPIAHNGAAAITPIGLKYMASERKTESGRLSGCKMLVTVTMGVSLFRFRLFRILIPRLQAYGRNNKEISMTFV